MNGNVDNPNIKGIKNVLKTYKKTLKHIGFAGPTFFVPLLQKFLTHVTHAQT